MFDLQALAFQADITRVITFQLARELSPRTYPSIGVTGQHHATSHHGGNAAKMNDVAKIDAYHILQEPRCGSWIAEIILLCVLSVFV